LVEKWQKNLSKKSNKAYTNLCNSADKFDKNNRINLIFICLICVIAFAFAFFMNSKTHISLDDYAYHFIFLEEDTGDGGTFNTGERVESISDIFTSMKAHYNTVNGRVVLHFIVQLMLLLGKPVFNVFNSAVLVLLILLIYLHCKGKYKRQSAAVFIMCALGVWTFAPSLGLTIFWLDGSINYMWGSVFRLAALLPFRFYYDSGKLSRQWLVVLPIMLMCILAGASNENTSAAFIFMILIYIVLYCCKGFKVPVWAPVGFVSAVASYLFMVLSPSIYSRVTAERKMPMIKYMVILLSNMVDKLMPFIAAALILATLLAVLKKKEKVSLALPFVYMLGACAGAFMMTFSKYFPNRAWFGCIIMAIISVGMLVYQLTLCDNAVVRRVVLICALCWMVWGVFSFARSAYDAMLVDKAFDARDAYIEQQKAKGNHNLIIRSINPGEKRSPHYGVSDLSDDPEHMRNIDMAKYYGLNSVAVGENTEY